MQAGRIYGRLQVIGEPSARAPLGKPGALQLPWFITGLGPP
jgi:hypothetical protein